MMKFLIVLYLTIAMLFSFIMPVTSYMAGGTASGVQITSVSNFYKETTSSAQTIRIKKLGLKNFVDQAKSNGASMLNTIMLMTTFQFSLGSEAPPLVNEFIKDFFGLLSVLFILSVLQEMMKLVPWIK